MISWRRRLKSTSWLAAPIVYLLLVNTPVYSQLSGFPFQAHEAASAAGRRVSELRFQELCHTRTAWRYSLSLDKTALVFIFSRCFPWATKPVNKVVLVVHVNVYFVRV